MRVRDDLAYYGHGLVPAFDIELGSGRQENQYNADWFDSIGQMSKYRWLAFLVGCFVLGVVAAIQYVAHTKIPDGDIANLSFSLLCPGLFVGLAIAVTSGGLIPPGSFAIVLIVLLNGAIYAAAGYGVRRLIEGFGMAKVRKVNGRNGKVASMRGKKPR